MKISSFHKSIGDTVELSLEYSNVDNFDKVYISKVFSETVVPEEVLSLKNVSYGGTGFYYDKAPFLPDEIEHSKPDYSLYYKWVEMDSNGKDLSIPKNRNKYKYFLDYSIGFTTRFCFRGCPYCVNKNYRKVEMWSPLEEFVDEDKPKICLLDDNMFGCKSWKEVLSSLQNTRKPFQYKQGLDERLLTEEKAISLFSSRYDGDFIFAFDNFEDKKIIIEKLKLIRSVYKNRGQNIKFYVLCAFDRENKYDLSFWRTDLENTFKRIAILMKYNCLPYIMRYSEYNNSPIKGTYINLASWCNQPNFFKKKSYLNWCISDDKRKKEKTGKDSATIRYVKSLFQVFPDFPEYLLQLRFEEENRF